MWDKYWEADVLYLHSLLHPKVGCSSTYSLSVLLANRLITMSISVNSKLETSTEKNILEKAETVKTEKLQNQAVISEAGVVLVCFGYFEEEKWSVKQKEAGSVGNTLKEAAVEKQSCQSAQAFQHNYIPFNSYNKRKTNSETSSKRPYLNLSPGFNKKATFKYRKTFDVFALGERVYIAYRLLQTYSSAYLLFKLALLEYFVVSGSKCCHKTERSTL